MYIVNGHREEEGQHLHRESQVPRVVLALLAGVLVSAIVCPDLWVLVPPNLVALHNGSSTTM